MPTNTVTTIGGKPHIVTHRGRIPVVDSDELAIITLHRPAMLKGVAVGVPRDKENCAYATAIKAERTVSVVDVRVAKNHTYLCFAEDPSKFVKFKNAKAIQEFVQSFDDADGKAIAVGDSFTLHLMPVPPSERQGHKKGKSGTQSKRKSPSYYIRRSER